VFVKVDINILCIRHCVGYLLYCNSTALALLLMAVGMYSVDSERVLKDVRIFTKKCKMYRGNTYVGMHLQYQVSAS
jgi:hypothetical protein